MQQLLTIAVALCAFSAAIRVPTAWTPFPGAQIAASGPGADVVSLPEPLLSIQQSFGDVVNHQNHVVNLVDQVDLTQPSQDVLTLQEPLPNVLEAAHLKYAHNKDAIRRIALPQRYVVTKKVNGRPTGPNTVIHVVPKSTYKKPLELKLVDNSGRRRIVFDLPNAIPPANRHKNLIGNFAEPLSPPLGGSRHVQDFQRLMGPPQRLPYVQPLKNPVGFFEPSSPFLQMTLQRPRVQQQQHQHPNALHAPVFYPSRPVDQFSFVPLPKPVHEDDEEEVAFQKRKQAILLKSHRDDRTHEPANEAEVLEADDDDEEDDDDEAERLENEEDEGEEVEDDEEEENSPVSEHETPPEVPTKPVYPGEGKWAQRGVKHRPYVSPHQSANLAAQDEDDKKPDGHDVFDKVQDVFQRQSNVFGNNLNSFPANHKLGSYIEPSPESQPLKKEHKEEQNDEGTANNGEFVPVQVYTQVRKTEDEEHLPPIYEGPHKLREVIKDSKVQTVYTEEGYEDVAYDHAGHEKEAAENEGFAEAEEEVEKEKLQKAPRLKFKGESSEDSSIEESNYGYGQRIVAADGEPVTEPESEPENDPTEKPAYNIKNNNHFVKTEETKTMAVKDLEDGGKEMEVLKEMKVMMMPDKDGKTMNKVIEIAPRKQKLPKKYQPEPKEDAAVLNIEDVISLTTTEGPDQPVMISDTIPLPTTSTEPLSQDIPKNHKPEDRDVSTSTTTTSQSKSASRELSDALNPTSTESIIDFINWTFHEPTKNNDTTPESKSASQELNDALNPTSTESVIDFINWTFHEPTKNNNTTPQSKSASQELSDALNPTSTESAIDFIDWTFHVPNENNDVSRTVTVEELLANVGPKVVLEETPDVNIDPFVDKPTVNIRKKRFTNDFDKVEIDTDFIDHIDHRLPPRPKDKTPEKYPYYFDKHIKKENPNSALRYSEDIKNAPVKKYGEMTFYDQAQERMPCDEVESEVDPIPERVEDAEENAKDMKQSDDVAELAESPRLQGLGDKIKCFKNRYFGENPLDSPFFKEDFVDPVTPPYDMLSFHNKKPSATAQVKNNVIGLPVIVPITESPKEAHDDPNLKVIPLIKVLQTVTNADGDQLSENASTLAEDAENEINIDDPERILKETLTDLARFKDDYDTAAEVKEEPNEKAWYNLKSRTGDVPTKFVLNFGKDIANDRSADQNGSVLDDLSPIKLPKVIRDPNKDDGKIHDEVITLHPDAELVDVAKLPEVTTSEPLNIITTPNYTIDLVPKHIYDQIQLLSYLPKEKDSTPNVNRPHDVMKGQLPHNLPESGKSGTKETTEDQYDLREPKILVIDEQVKKKTNGVASDRTDQNQPESMALRRKVQRKRRRKRPFVIFDVNKFWPTTPYPLFQQKIKLSTVKPTHDANSEVRYKDEIKPSDQMTVLKDVLTIIRNASLQEPLMVAESQESTKDKPAINRGRLPLRSGAHNGIPLYHPGVSPDNNPPKTQYNSFYVPVNLGPKTTHQILLPQPHPEPPKQNDELSTKLKNTELTTAQREEDPEEQDEITYYTNQEIEKVRPDAKVDASSQEKQDTSEETDDSPDDSPADSTNNESPQEGDVNNIHNPATQILGLMPPGAGHYSTIYSLNPQQQQYPTTVYTLNPQQQHHPATLYTLNFQQPQQQQQQPVIPLSGNEVLINRFFVEGMRPPPRNQIVTLYHEIKPTKFRRRNHKLRRSRRQATPGYTELVRSRGPQYQTSAEIQEDSSEDDYVPHRPKNYHYDEATGKIVYDKKPDEDDELEYAVVYEEVTEPPIELKTTTLSWIATVKPNKDEQPLLYFVEQLKKHPNYKLIPDPTTTEKGKEGEGEISTTTPTPVSTTPPPFLELLAKVKADSNYKLIPDKTTAEPTKAASAEATESSEVVEESKVEDVKDSADKQDEQVLSDLIFDISEFLPKPRRFKPKTEVDYSKYKTIERPQVTTRHNLSSKYNAENATELQEVSTTEIPNAQLVEDDDMETEGVSESRIDVITSEAPTYQQDESTTVKSRRRKVNVTAVEATSTTTTESPVQPSSLATETVTLFDDSLTATSPATVDATSSDPTPTITRETTSTTTAATSTTTSTSENPTVSTVRRVRIRGRIRSTTPKPVSSSTQSDADPNQSQSTPEADALPQKPKEEVKKVNIRRRSQRVRSRTTTEQFFDASDLDSPAKTIRRRQSSYYDSEEIQSQVPYRFDPVLLGDRTAAQTTQKPKIRRRPRVRIQKNNYAGNQNTEATTYRASVAPKEVPTTERQIRRRQRINTRTRLRNTNAVNDGATLQSSRNVATGNLVSTEQPQLRGKTRLNRIAPINSNTRSFNRARYVPEEDTTVQPLRYTQTVPQSTIPVSRGSPGGNLASFSEATKPSYNAYLPLDSSTQKSLRYTPVVLQSGLSQANVDSEKNPNVNLGLSSFSGASYPPVAPTTPQPFRYAPSIQYGRPGLAEPSLVPNRRSDQFDYDSDEVSSTGDTPYISEDVYTPKPFKYTAVIDDAETTEAARAATRVRGGHDRPTGRLATSRFNDAQYFHTSTFSPFRYRSTIPQDDEGVSRSLPNVRGVSGEEQDASQEGEGGATTPGSLDFSYLYNQGKKQSGPLPRTRIAAQSNTPSDIVSPDVDAFSNEDSSTQRLPYSAAPIANLRASSIQQSGIQPEPQLTTNRRDSSNIHIPPPNDAYLDAYITTPLPSTIGKIIPGNIARPTESPSIPVRRRGRVINRGDPRNINEPTRTVNSPSTDDSTQRPTEQKRVRGGNLRRRPQRTRGGGANLQQQTPESAAPPRGSINPQPQRTDSPPAVRQRVVDADARSDIDRTHTKKVNVEVYQPFDPQQRHGGNYRREDEDPEVEEAVSKKSEKIILTPEGQTGNVNVEGQRVYNNRQAFADNAKDSGATATIQPPAVTRNHPTNEGPKKANVEVYKNFNPNQKHGGNYKEEGDVSDVVESATLSHRSLNPEKAPPKKVNTETLKNVDPKHYGLYADDSSEEQEQQPKVRPQAVVLAPETTQSKTVEAFRQYNPNQRHGGNYRREYDDDAEVIEPKLVSTKSEKIIQPPARPAPKTIHYEVFDSYNAKQKHGGNYRSEDDDRPESGENRGSALEPERTQTKKVKNVEVLKPYDLKQKHGGNYKKENQDADYEESEIVNDSNEESAEAALENLNGGVFGANGASRVPSIYIEPPKISLPPPTLTGIPEDAETGRLNVEIYKPYAPAPREPHHTTKKDHPEEIDRINVELLKPHLPAPRTGQNAEYTRNREYIAKEDSSSEEEDYSEEATTQRPIQRPQRRRRPINRNPDAVAQRNRNALRRRDPKSLRGSTGVAQNNLVRPNNPPPPPPPPPAAPQIEPSPTRSADVEVFQDYDRKVKHGGNYRREDEGDAKEQESSPRRSPLADSSREEVTEDTRVRPLGLYNDPKLAKNINHLKEIGIPETATEEIIRDVKSEEEPEEAEKETEADYGWINVKAISSTTARPLTIVTTTKARVPKVIKDPSKRLYYYAAV